MRLNPDWLTRSDQIFYGLSSLSRFGLFQTVALVCFDAVRKNLSSLKQVMGVVHAGDFYP